MNLVDTVYLDLLKRILGTGFDMPDRTGTGRRSLFGEQLKFVSIAEEFPMLTTKRIWFNGVMEELLWFLRGEDNITSLQDAGVYIWDEWAEDDGSVGPVYGVQWRSWGCGEHCIGALCKCSHDANEGPHVVDQIANVIAEIKANPWSRRLVVSAWNVAQIEEMALPPCHLFFQFQVTPGSSFVRCPNPQPALLNCHMYMRSADVFLGVPFNIASYALLTCMMAQVTGLEANNLTISFGDVYIYHNHFNQVEEQLSRTEGFVLPRLALAQVADIDAFTSEDIVLENYLCHPPIKAPIAV